MKRKQHSTEEIIRILRQVDEDQTGRCGMPRSQHLQSHLSPLETQIRWHGPSLSYFTEYSVALEISLLLRV